MNLTLVRRAALNLLHLERTKKSVRQKQKLVGWSQEHFLKASEPRCKTKLAMKAMATKLLWVCR